MSRVAKIQATMPKELRALYAPVRDELEQVEEMLRTELTSRFPFVDRMVKHGFRLGGKRLRPALVLLSAQSSGRSKPDHLVLAVAVELIHTATLTHDDVLDEATMRRHLDTVNARWDNEASILLGDYLVAHAISMVGALESTFACRAIGDACQVMCQGELRQIESRGRFDLGEDEYLEIIAEKTAALCACCCRLGSYYAGAEPRQQEALVRYGTDLGVAFQITDDLLDILGDEATAGKSLGTDLVKEKATLPLIRLLNQSGAAERAEVLGILSRSGNHRSEALRPWFHRTDALAYARQKAVWFTQRAREHLAILPPTPARTALEELADFVVSREQ
jgi:octaprenyl-diphosphate synthase